MRLAIRPLEFKKSPNWYGVTGGALLQLVIDRPVLACSDDSQMTLATLYGIRSSVGGQQVVDCVNDAYLAWFAGQIGQPITSEWLAGYRNSLGETNLLTT